MTDTGAPSDEASTRICDCLEARISEIMSAWEVELRSELPIAGSMSRPLLIDHIPQLLERIIEWLRPEKQDHDVPAPGDEFTRLAEFHAGVRLGEGFDLREVVHEYRVLRRCILRSIERAGVPAGAAEMIRLNAAIDVAVADMAGHYAEVRHAALRESQSHLQQVINTIPVGVWVAAPDGAIIMHNAEAARIWGTPPPISSSQEYGQFKAWRRDGTPVTADEWALMRSLKTGETILDEELEIETFEGTRKIIRNSSTALLDDRGRVGGGIAINWDVTEHDRLAEARDRFIAILGHDLRNPLNAILITSRALLKNEASNERVIRAAGRIGRAADRMARMISDLLDFARGSLGGKFELSRQHMGLAEVAKSVVEELEVAHPDRTIAFRSVGSDRGDWDRDRIAQVVSNLIGNALRHGTGPVAVAVDGLDPEVVRVTVHNGGAPIPPGLMPHLFDPFRHSADADPEGLGLELYIVREIVHAHQGRVSVSSTAETGTSFTVELPRTAAPS